VTAVGVARARFGCSAPSSTPVIAKREAPRAIAEHAALGDRGSRLNSRRSEFERILWSHPGTSMGHPSFGTSRH
jgi:hypothetical protein